MDIVHNGTFIKLFDAMHKMKTQSGHYATIIIQFITEINVTISFIQNKTRALFESENNASTWKKAYKMKIGRETW